MPPSRSSSTGRGRGGGGGRGRGRGRGMARSPGRGRGRGFAGARSLHVDEDVATEVNEFANESAGFFSDLTGVRRSAAPREEASTEQSVKEGSTLPAPGELLATKVVTGSEQTQDRVLWLELGLCKALIRAVTHLGFIAPTPVQAEAIPAALNGTDVCARAVTGSGKTAAFLLPLAHLLLTRPPQKSTMLNSKRRYIRAVILLPTRELGVQCESMLKSLLQFTTGLTVALAIGGVAPSAQEAALDAVPDILIATPGRLVDFLHNHKQGVDLTGVEVAVLDECDQMLNLNLKDQVLDVLERIPVETRQVLMFSATMTEEVDEFATEHLYKPRNVDIGHVALQAKLRQQFIRILDTEEKAAAEEEEPAEKTKRIRSKRLREEAKAASGEDAAAESGDARSKIKSRYLVALCQNYFKDQALIFCRYRTTVHRLAILFNALGLSASEIQGNQTQEERFAALEAFSSGKVHYLITTDVAARGLDILSVKTVINFDLPPSLTAYIHRVGRTARIGTSGTAVSLVHEVEDSEIMRRILAVSGAIHEHQVASVKRRDVPADLLKKAMMDIDRVFPEVRGQLQAEQLEERIALAEKRFGRKKDAVDPVTGQITVRAKKEWCLSKAEKNRRDEEARLAYEKEAEVTVNRFQNELSTLEREESSILQKMKVSRRNDREKKNREKEKLKEKAKELRRKAEKKVQAGVVKKLKKQKIRASIRERRADEREKKGHAPFKHGDGRKSNKKSRHRKRIKRH